MDQPSKKCFVVSPIGDSATEVRKRSDGFLVEVIRPVATGFGYVVERADEDKSPGMVTEAIINKIIDADLVIADLHGHNPNVMYEVAIRHASNKPLVQMIERGESLPFDIGGMNTIFYDPAVAGLAQMRADLTNAIAAVESGATGSNPVARAGLIKTLSSSPDGEKELLSTLLQEIQQVRQDVRVVRNSSAPPTFKVFDGSRVLMPPDQYVHKSLVDFITTHPSMAGNQVVIDVRDGQVTLSLLPALGEGMTTNYKYKFDQHLPINEEVFRLKTEIRRDIGKLPPSGLEGLLPEWQT